MPLPIDCVSTWVRGNTLFVRFPHSHTIKLPVDRPDLFIRVMRQRAVAAARLHAEAKPHDMPAAGMTQHDIDAWLHAGNKPKQLPAGNSMTGMTVRETAQDRLNRSAKIMEDLLAEY